MKKIQHTYIHAFTNASKAALNAKFPGLRDWSRAVVAKVYAHGSVPYVLVTNVAGLDEGFGGVCGAQAVADFILEMVEDVAGTFAASIREALNEGVRSGMIAREIDDACKRVQRSQYASAERALAEKGLGALLAKWARCFH